MFFFFMRSPGPPTDCLHPPQRLPDPSQTALQKGTALWYLSDETGKKYHPFQKAYNRQTKSVDADSKFSCFSLSFLSFILFSFRHWSWKTVCWKKRILRNLPRACLKKAFRELRVPVCGRFYPNEGKIYRKVGLADCGNDFSDTL